MTKKEVMTKVRGHLKFWGCPQVIMLFRSANRIATQGDSWHLIKSKRFGLLYWTKLRKGCERDLVKQCSARDLTQSYLEIHSYGSWSKVWNKTISLVEIVFSNNTDLESKPRKQTSDFPKVSKISKPDILDLEGILDINKAYCFTFVQD